MIKSGKTAAGSQRWKCTSCRASSTAPRSDQSALTIFTTFLSYLAGKLFQAEISGNTGRGLRRRWAWCWTVPTPAIEITGEIYDQLFIDGIYLPYNWCLLVAHNGAHVVARQWCRRENSAAYTALLSQIPPPDLVTTDGHGGAAKALKQLWPQVPVQRCLVHVHRNNLRDLTSRPNTPAGKALLELSRRLLKVTTKEEAATWVKLLIEFNTEYGSYLKERTYAHDVPPSQRRSNQKWWYTHERDRRVYRRLASLHGKGHLFAFLEFDTPRHKTTNPVESFNNCLRSVLLYHRGLSQAHMITAIDWYCYTHCEFPRSSREILTQWEKAGRPARRLIPKKKQQPAPSSDEPQRYGTALSAEEGLWTRKGWAGCSK
ncbi:IS1249 family transposase [Ancrocorticia populi]|uniref:IS1249 family transposase n=2 Tax=Ancrocorticia populi TaxID=2175228 RepID=A0A2V1K4I0_9ACTO|nr:IS1249 family transposase [Ancrocorticia populi]